MPRKMDTSPLSLYVNSLNATLSMLKKLRAPDITFANREWIMDRFPGSVISDLMEAAIIKCCVSFNRILRESATNERLLFTPRVTRGTIFCKPEDFLLLSVRCKNLKQLVLVKTDSQGSISNILNMPRLSQVIFIHYPHHLIVYNQDLRRLWPPRLLDSSRKIVEEHLLSVGCRLCDAIPLTTVTSVASSLIPVELYLPGIPLSPAEIQQLLVVYPRIRVLRHRHLLSALYSLHKNTDEAMLRPRYELRNLDYVRWDIHDLLQRSTTEEILKTELDVLEAVRLAVRLCPRIGVVCVTYNFNGPPPAHHVLDILYTLDHIQGLTVSANYNIVDMNRKLYTCLKKHGRNIKTLELNNFISLDAELIVFYCPNMMGFFLYDVSLTHEVVRPKEFQQTELINLRDLCVCNQIDFPCILWPTILTSRLLTIIKLFNISVDLNVLDQVTALNYWRDLRGLFVVNCESLRRQHIMSLLNSDNNLREVEILFCTGITEEDKNTIERRISEMKFDIKCKFRCWN